MSWSLQNRHEGDRVNLFTAVAQAIDAGRVLYPGSFVDVAASAVFASVLYVDMDRRAKSFFDDEPGVREIIGSLGGDEGNDFSFVSADYRELDLAPESFDLLISLYAGFISEHCTGFLRIGGHLLANPSHGDAAMASIDPSYELVGVLVSRSGPYSVRTNQLDQYMVPKRPVDISPEMLHERGRGIAYTKPAFAYLFRRVA